MVKKSVCLWMAAAILCLLSIQAEASQSYGSIHVSLNAGELPVTNGAITLYQVGEPVKEGYRIIETLGGGIIKKEDAASEHLALWLADGVGETGKSIFLDVDGNVTFSNLEQGLYLLCQTERMDGFHPIEPVLAAIPTNNQWSIEIMCNPDPIIADNPQTGQEIWPLLGAMGMVASGMGIYLCIDSKRKNK